MANEQLRERLARYIDQYKDDKESGVNMGTVGLAMGYKSGAAVVSAYLSGTYKGRVDTLEARLEEYFRNVEARTEQDSKLADIPMPKDYVKLSISERVFTSIRLAHMRGSIVAVVGDSGIGKTKAALEYNRHRNRRVHVEKCWRNSITKDDVRLLFPALAKEGHEKEFDLMYGMCRSWSAVRGAVSAYINAADSCRESGVEMDYNALFKQAQTINPTIGAGRI